MRKLIVSEFMTLDGVMEAPEKWQFPYFSGDMEEFIRGQILATDVMLLGRVTYEIFAAYWPHTTTNEFGIADKLNSSPKLVVSSTLGKADWNNSTLIKSNALGEIMRLKQAQPDGVIGTTGSTTLVQSLMDADLVDKYQLTVHPIVLGSGKRLFKDGMASHMKLVEMRAFSGGVVLLRYQPDKKSSN